MFDRSERSQRGDRCNGPRRAGPLAGLTGALLAAACGGAGDPGPARWVHLSRGFEPTPLLERARQWASEDGRPGLSVRAHDAYGQVWIETSIERERWRAGDLPGEWITPQPAGGAFARAPVAGMGVAHGGDDLARIFPDQPPIPGGFRVEEGRLHLHLDPDEELGAAVRYGVRIGQGLAFDGTWRVRAPGLAADGLPVWSGAEQTLSCDVPAEASLRFVTRWVAGTPGESAEGAAPRFRVHLGEHELLDFAGQQETYHALELPRGTQGPGHLRFSVEGPAGLGLFVAPSLAPREVGEPHRRPWGDARPNLVIFLADTFRADNLALHGDEDQLAPNLNALAARSLAFTRARATSSWTLPSIASILTGMAPGQHGATDEDRTLSYDLTTLGEVFTAHGYRTGAVTDAAFFTQTFGLDQGFEWFEETSFPAWDLARTFDSALRFLDRDDGRPFLLVVHTYRTHAPYRPEPGEDATRWNELMVEGYRQLEEAPGGQRAAQERICLAFSDRFRELYRGGVRALDAGFGRFLTELERRRVLEPGYLVFTSDHGEAFGENGEVFHGAGLWDAKLHVPLFLHGPDLEPGRSDRPASLTDLAGTLADLAGVGRAPAWQAPSLLSPAVPGDQRQPVYAFQLRDRDRRLAIVDGERKLFAAPDPEGLARGEFQQAFDLASDPGEERPLEAPPWAAELCRRVAEQVALLLLPQATPGQLGAGAAVRPNLAAIGYGDD